VSGVQKSCRVVCNAPYLIGWMRRHGDAATVPLCEAFLKALKEEERASKIALAGFCWGARYALLFTTTHAPRADVAVLAHPSGISLGDVTKTTVPTLFINAENDPMFPPATADKAAAALREKGVPTESVTYPGTQVGG
jgi:dienelactone hydrolase